MIGIYQVQVFEKIGSVVVKSSNLEQSMASKNAVRLNLYNTQEGSKMSAIIYPNKTIMIFSKDDKLVFNWSKKQANQWLVESVAELGYELV